MSRSAVYKYVLGMVAPFQDVAMPRGPAGIQLLHVAFQHDELCLWARVSPGYPEQKVRIYTLPTGMWMGEAELGALYVGTVMSASHDFVLHVWAQVGQGEGVSVP